MQISRNMMYWAIAVPVLGAVGFGLGISVRRYVQPNTIAQAETTSSEVAVISEPGEQVDRIEQLKCEVAQGWPVVLVRDVSEQSPWWVQAPAKLDGTNKYKARVHFGNEKTESGQKFEIVVLSAPDASKAQQFETGTLLEDLPDDVPHSEPVAVVRR